MFARTFANTFRGQATRSAASLGRASAPRTLMWAAGAAGAGLATAALVRPSPIHLEGPKTIAGEAQTVSERSYVMIKPDGTARQLVGEIIATFERRGYKLVALKTVGPSQELAKQYVAPPPPPCLSLILPVCGIRLRLRLERGLCADGDAGTTQT